MIISIIKKVWNWKYTVLTLLAFASSGMIVMSTAAIPIYLEQLLQELGDYEKTAVSTMAFFSIVYTIRAAFKLIRNHITAYMGNSIVNVIREDALYSLIKKHQAPKRVASQYSVLTYDLTSISELLSWRTFVFMEDMLILILAIWNIGKIQPFMSYFILLMLLLIIIFSFVFGKRLQMGIRTMKGSISNIGRLLRENILNQKIVRAYDLQKKQQKKFYEANVQNAEAQEKIKNENKHGIPIMEGIAQATLLLSLSIGALFVAEGKNDIGFLALLNGYLFLLINVAASLGGLIYFFICSRESVRRINSILYLTGTVSETKSHSLENAPEKLSLKMSFCQSNQRLMYQNVNVIFNRGEITVIKGETGSGKTILADSVSWIKDEETEIYWNEMKLDKSYQKEYWQHLGYALQTPVFFHETVYNNISLWRKEVDCEWFSKVAENCALDFVRLLKDGFDTHINTDSNFLSGGEKQRICLARALIDKPGILVIDDSLQAIDKKNQTKIMDFLKQIKENMVIIIVSSDTEVINYADTIYEINANQVKSIEEN